MTTTLEEIEQTVEAPAVPQPTQYTLPEGIRPMPGYPYNGEHDDQFTLYVTRVKAGDRESWLNTFRFVTSSADGDEWTSSNRRVYGAVVDGTPRSGWHYLVFGKYIVRYNNEYELQRRNHSSSPWSVVAGPNGEAWPLPNDHVPALDPDDHYIAVEFDVSNLGQSDAAKPDWDDEYAAVTYGLHKTEEDGSVILNPELHVGELYLCWNQEAVASKTEFVRLGIYVGGGKVDQAFAYSGHYYKYSDSPYATVEFNAQYEYSTVADNWVKFSLNSATVETQTSTDQYDRKLARVEQEFTEFNEATNKLARERSWCSSYESITQKVGMKSRWHGWWYAEVKTTVCVTRDEVEGYTARDILSYLNMSGRKIRNLSMEAEMTFRIPAIRADSEELAKEKVDETLIRKALKIQNLEVQDFTGGFEVIGIYEDRDSAYNGTDPYADIEADSTPEALEDL
jgi:hypothetical protein